MNKSKLAAFAASAVAVGALALPAIGSANTGVDCTGVNLHNWGAGTHVVPLTVTVNGVTVYDQKVTFTGDAVQVPFTGGPLPAGPLTIVSTAVGFSGTYSDTFSGTCVEVTPPTPVTPTTPTPVVPTPVVPTTPKKGRVITSVTKKIRTIKTVGCVAGANPRRGYHVNRITVVWTRGNNVVKRKSVLRTVEGDYCHVNVMLG